MMKPMNDAKKLPGRCGECGGELDAEGWCARYCEDDEPSSPGHPHVSKLKANAVCACGTNLVGGFATVCEVCKGRNVKLAQSDAIRRAYLAGYLDATNGREMSLIGTYAPFYEAGFRFGRLIRAEAEKMAEHYSRDYLLTAEIDADASTEPPPPSTHRSQR